jgi:hypothetical protein
MNNISKTLEFEITKTRYKKIKSTDFCSNAWQYAVYELQEKNGQVKKTLANTKFYPAFSNVAEELASKYNFEEEVIFYPADIKNKYSKTIPSQGLIKESDVLSTEELSNLLTLTYKLYQDKKAKKIISYLNL